jgi:flagellar hook-basal body complex protein FliE
MNIHGLGNAGGAQPLRDPTSTGAGALGGFSNLLDQLTSASQQADGAIESLATDGEADLHDIMLAIEMESLSFELAVQIRNRLVEAYSEIFRMQV